jgi:RHS repeat-associated protein
MKYDSFGNIIEQNGEVSDSIVNPVQYPKPASLHFDLPFGFAGGLWDKDTKLVRFGVRDYDAETGRWTSKEPLGFAGARNFYVYAGNDGVNYVDLDGLLPDWFIFNSDFWEELGHHSVASLIGIGDGVTGGWIPGIDYSTTEFIRNKISFLMGSEYECKQIAGEYKKEKAYTAGLFLSFFINLKSKAMFERTKDFFKKFKKYNGYWKPENGRIVPNRKGF